MGAVKLLGVERNEGVVGVRGKHSAGCLACG
jgi:hypothetical protein